MTLKDERFMAGSVESRRWRFADFSEIAPVACPCGQARRAFQGVPEFPGTLHITEISEDAQRHYHRKLTETYVILKCDADAGMELDGEIIPIREHQSIVIPPGVRHRALGRMTVLIIVMPEFDPQDEWFD
jgi:mannose-6-phosphate isomerase-like protein (cupin superfamily)